MQESRAGCPQRRLSARQSRNSCAPPRRVNRTTGLRSKPTSARSLAGDFFSPRRQNRKELKRFLAQTLEGARSLKSFACSAAWRDCFLAKGAKTAKSSNAFSHKRSRVPEV